MPELRSSETVCAQSYTYERSRGQFVVSVPPRVGYRFYARSIAAVCHRRQRQDFWGTRVQYLVSVPHGAVYRSLHECSTSLECCTGQDSVTVCAQKSPPREAYGMLSTPEWRVRVQYPVLVPLGAVCRSATRAVSAARRGIR